MSVRPKHWHNRAGIIRRVVSVGKVFVCGICRLRYEQQTAAQNCFSGCWNELLNLEPVIERVKQGRASFRCRYCAREHSAYNGAFECAEVCREVMISKHAAEQAVRAGAMANSERPRSNVPKPNTHSPVPQYADEDDIDVVIEDEILDDSVDYQQYKHDDTVEEISIDESDIHEISVTDDEPIAETLEDWATVQEEEDRELEEIVDVA